MGDIVVNKEYSPVSSPYIIYHNLNHAGEAADSTAVKITIIRAGTTLIDAAAMDHDDTGDYSYTYHKGASEDPMTKGQYIIRVDAIDGTGDDAITSSFFSSFKVI